MAQLAWLIPVLPFLAFGLISFLGDRAPGRGASLAIGAMLLAATISLVLLGVLLGGVETIHQSLEWAPAGDHLLRLGIQVDHLTAVMLVVVTVVGSLIFIYSQGYMEGDPRYARFFAHLSLFAGGMLLLVLADNFLFLFAGWELVGLGSYLLIGFWFERPAAARASMKAFITTRIGDLFMFAGILVIFYTIGSLEFSETFEALEEGRLGGGLRTLVALLLFGGAVGKSAQVPLHVWLPDAMEGPTPVSALIHAATMVAAGVYLVARMFGLFFASPGHEALTVVAWVGGITALMAATMGVVQDDIKRVLAYSTISQLGYMMLGLGVLGYTAGVFHLMTHAFFKALLFLGAGSVIHAVHTNDIKQMGGLARVMPSTYWTFLIGTLALAGVFPFAGFWSKDEILLEAMHHNPPLYYLGLVVAFLTAFYMMRVVFYTFTGEPRWAKVQHADPAHGAGPAHDGGHAEAPHPHESPSVMTVPLWVLAVFSTLIGFVGAPFLGNPFHDFIHVEGVEAAPFDLSVAAFSTAAAVLGIAAAAVVYRYRLISSAAVRRAFGPLVTLVEGKYFFDELYARAVIAPTVWVATVLRVFDTYIIDGFVNLVGVVIVGLARLYRLFDLYVVDGLVNMLGWITTSLGGVLRYLQTGRAHNYLLVIALGVLVIILGGLLR